MSESVLRGAEAQSLDEDWRKLWEATSGALAFNHPDWLMPWWGTLGKETEPYLAVVREGDELQGIAPLTRRQSTLGAILKPAGEGVSDYTDWLLPDPCSSRSKVLTELADVILDQPDWIGMELSGWRNEADARELAQRIAQSGAHTRLLPGLICPFVSMPQGFDAYYRSRGSQARYNVRSRERRLGQHGVVRYEHASFQDAPRVVEEAIVLHSRRWQGQRTSTVFSSSAAGRAFYRASIPLAVQQRFGDLATLTLNGHVIASAIGFQIAEEYGYYLTAWHPGYHPYAPGTLLLVHLMENASRQGARRFDFMLGDEPYKTAWATDQRRVHTMIAARPSASGRLWLMTTLAYGAVRERARRSARLRQIRRHGLSGIGRGIDSER